MVHKKETANIFAVVVPVAKVAVDLKFVPHVSTNELTPDVVTTNVARCPVTPPLPLKVQAPDGVIVIIGVVMLTVIVPVVADVAADEPALLANGNTPVTLVVRSMLPARSALRIAPVRDSFEYAILPAKSAFKIAPVKDNLL